MKTKLYMNRYKILHGNSERGMKKDTWSINVIYIFLVIKIQANTLITKIDINSSYMLTLFSHQYCGSTFLIKLTPLTGDLFIKNKSSTSLLGVYY